MLSSHYTFALVAADLNRRLSGKRITGAYTQDRDQMIVEFDGEGPLVFSCRAGLNALFLHPGFARARRNTVDLLPGITGRTVGGVAIDDTDRIVTITLDSSLRLEAWFFGSTANVYLLSEDGAPIDSFRKIPLPERTQKTVGFVFHGNIHDLDSAPGEKALAVLRRIHPAWSTVLATEALVRAAVRPETHWSDLTLRQKQSLESSVAEIIADLSAPHAFIYTGRTGLTLSLIRLHQFRGAGCDAFDDIHAAIRTMMGRTYARKRTGDRREALRKNLHTMLEKDRKSVLRVEADLAGADRGTEFNRYGMLLLNNLSSFKKGDTVCVLDDDGKPVRISLLPGLAPSANAQRYFDKAKKASGARTLLTTRRADLQRRIDLVSSLLRSIEEVGSEADLREFIRLHSDQLRRLGMTREAGRDPAPPFRIFTVEGGFEVWAGKNSKSNDDLTLRHAKPEDLWFHARGAGGSHVVLKVSSAKGEPGKRARTQAAGIAAYYSKMKNAGLVPVAMTKKKYVRKPKGAPPGTVIVEREEVILTRPTLPESSTPEGTQ